MLWQPQIIFHSTMVLGIALLFFILIPGIGAFHIRSTWRKFRELLYLSTRLKKIDYSTMRSLRSGDSPSGRSYRFFGRLQALEKENIVWLSDWRLSIQADLNRVHVFLLTSDQTFSIEDWEQYPSVAPRRMLWKRVSTLPEHTKVFISGTVDSSQGRPMFVDSSEQRLLVLIYEGAEEDLLYRATWNGRQKNEYWNPLTPGSLALGSFSLFLYSYLLPESSVYFYPCLLYTSPSPRDRTRSRMPSSA